MNKLLRLLLLTLTIAFAASSAKVYAQDVDYYWTANGDSDNWSDIGNWASRPAGSTDALQPATAYPNNTTDNVFFDAQEYNPSNSDITVVVDVADAASADFNGANATSGGGTFQLTGLAANKLTVAGDYSLEASPAASNTFEGITEFTSSGNINTDVAFEGPVVFNNAGGTWNLNAPLSVNDLTIQSGTLRANGNNITLSGDWTSNTGTFNAGSGTVFFGGASAINTNSTFNNVSINAGATTSLTTAISVNGNLDIDGTLDAGVRDISVNGNLDINGTLNVGANNITLAGNWTSNNGTFNAGTSTVFFNGPASTINTSSAFNNLTVNAGRTANLSSDITVNKDLTINGTLNDNGNQINGTAAGTVTIGNGATLRVGAAFPTNFIPNLNTGSTVIYSSSQAQTIRGGIAYGNLVVSGGSTKTLGGNITINGNVDIQTGNTLDVSASNYTIDLKGNWAGTGTFNARTGNVTFSGSNSVTLPTVSFHSIIVAKTAPASVKLTDAITLAGNLSITSGTLNADGNDITLAGNWTSTGTFTAGSGTVIFNGTTSTISSSASSAFNNLTVNAGTTANLATAINVNGNLSVSGTLNDNGNQINGTTGKVLTVNNGGTLRLGSATFPTNFTTDFKSGSTVLYTGNNQTIGGGTYANLQITGGGIKTLGGNITVNGDVVIPSGNTLDVSSANRSISVSGNWTSNGNFVARAGTVTFNGASNQSISTIPPTGNEFFNVVINKPGGGITLNSDVSIGEDLGNANVPNNTVNGGIDFIKGIMTIPNEANSLIINRSTIVVGSNRTATNPLSLTGGSSESYVDGYILKKHSIENQLITFPLGDAGFYRPAGLFFNNNNRGDFRVRYFNAQPPSYNENAPVSITAHEYWEIRRVAGNASARVALSWQIPISGPAPSPSRPTQQQNYLPCCTLAQAQNIIVATKTQSGTSWESRGGSDHNITNNNPNTYAGFLQTNNAASNDDRIFWTLGSTVTPLPIELLYFQALLQEGIVELNWATAQEVDNDYFTIEKSADGQTFTELLRIKGAGNSAEIKQYQTTDTQPYRGLSYYRLKQTDLDGKFSYSKVVAVNNDKGGNFLQAYQSSSGQLQVSYELAAEQTGILSVYDSKGRQVWSKSVKAANYQEQIPLSSANGLYLVTLQSSEGTLVKKVVIY